MDSRQPHGRQLKRTPGRQPILAKKESNVVEIRIDRVPKKTDWKEVGGGDRDKWNQRLLELVPRALPINPETSEANRHSEQDGRILKGR